MRFPRPTAAIAVSLLLAATAAHRGAGSDPRTGHPGSDLRRSPGRGDRAAARAHRAHGVRLPRGGLRARRHGQPGRQAFDCSGLVYRTFRDAAGLELPRSVSGLLASGRAAEAPLHVGDLLFFDTLEGGQKGTPDHVGIYAGAGRFVHAASEGLHRGVTVSSLDQDYYRSRFTGARRLLAWNTPSMEIDVTSAAAGRAEPGRARRPDALPERPCASWWPASGRGAGSWC